MTRIWDDETAALDVPPATHVHAAARPRRKVFPRGWPDVREAAAVVLLLASATVPLALTWILLGRHL